MCKVRTRITISEEDIKGTNYPWQSVHKNIERIYKKIAKAFHVKPEDIPSMIKDGKIKVKVKNSKLIVSMGP